MMPMCGEKKLNENITTVAHLLLQLKILNAIIYILGMSIKRKGCLLKTEFYYQNQFIMIFIINTAIVIIPKNNLHSIV